MAISKRLRYEVLRRDNHTCRYCGGVAPDVKLTVDHVLPTALGGTDKADNLVAACADCNAGKSSSNPIEILRLRGMPASVIAEGAVLALARDTVTADSKWRYFMGIMWKKLTEIEEVARQVFEAETQADE